MPRSRHCVSPVIISFGWIVRCRSNQWLFNTHCVCHTHMWILFCFTPILWCCSSAFSVSRACNSFNCLRFKNCCKTNWWYTFEWIFFSNYDWHEKENKCLKEMLLIYIYMCIYYMFTFVYGVCKALCKILYWTVTIACLFGELIGIRMVRHAQTHTCRTAKWNQMLKRIGFL